MRCDACGSETPPHYEHALEAWICHTCKALGRIVEGAFCPDAVEPDKDGDDGKAEMPPIPTQDVAVSEALQENTQTPLPSKKKTTKLKP